MIKKNLNKQNRFKFFGILFISIFLFLFSFSFVSSADYEIYYEDDFKCLQPGNNYDINLSLWTGVDFDTYSVTSDYGVNSEYIVHTYYRLENGTNTILVDTDDYVYLSTSYAYTTIPVKDEVPQITSSTSEPFINVWSGDVPKPENYNVTRMYFEIWRLNSGETWNGAPTTSEGTKVYDYYDEYGYIQILSNCSDLNDTSPYSSSSSNFSLFDGLISFYPLNETSGTTANDEVGTNDGTNNGSTVNSTGKIGTAYDFDGSNDYVNLNFAPSYSLGTVSFWYKGNAGAGDRFISSFGATLQNGQFDIGLVSGGFLSVGIWNGASKTVTGTTTINDNNWHHIVLTWESGGNVILYVDGSSEGTPVSAGTFTPANTQNAWIGEYPRSSGYWLPGTIDEVMIFNRSLNSTEISQLYNSSSGYSYFGLTSSTPSTPDLDYSLVTNMSTVNMLYNESDYYDTTDYFVLNSSNIGDYDGACFLNYTDPTNSNSLQLKQGVAFPVTGSANSNYFEVYLNSNCSIQIDSYEVNHTSSMSWGLCDSSEENCNWTTFQLNINDTVALTSPSEDVPFSCLHIDNCIYSGGDIYLYGDVNFSFNDYYSNYEYIGLDVDSYLFSVDLDDNESESFAYSNYNITLDPTIISDDMYLIYSSSGSANSYNNFSVCNSAGCISDYFYYFSTEEEVYGYPNFLNLTMDFNENQTFNLDDYFSNFSDLEIGFWFNGTRYNVSKPAEGYYSGMVSDYFGVYVFSNNTILIQTFEESLDQDFYVDLTKTDSTIERSSFNLIVGDGFIAEDYANFTALKYIFPEIESESVSRMYAFVVILALLVIGIIFVGLPLRFSVFSLIVIAIMGLFASFVMATVGYSPWSWFVVPSVLIVGYFVFKLLFGGGD